MFSIVAEKRGGRAKADTTKYKTAPSYAPKFTSLPAELRILVYFWLLRILTPERWSYIGFHLIGGRLKCTTMSHSHVLLSLMMTCKSISGELLDFIWTRSNLTVHLFVGHSFQHICQVIRYNATQMHKFNSMRIVVIGNPEADLQGLVNAHELRKDMDDGWKKLSKLLSLLRSLKAVTVNWSAWKEPLEVEVEENPIVSKEEEKQRRMQQLISERDRTTYQCRQLLSLKPSTDLHVVYEPNHMTLHATLKFFEKDREETREWIQGKMARLDKIKQKKLKVTEVGGDSG